MQHQADLTCCSSYLLAIKEGVERSGGYLATLVPWYQATGAGNVSQDKTYFATFDSQWNDWRLTVKLTNCPRSSGGDQPSWPGSLPSADLLLTC